MRERCAEDEDGAVREKTDERMKTRKTRDATRKRTPPAPRIRRRSSAASTSPSRINLFRRIRARATESDRVRCMRASAFFVECVSAREIYLDPVGRLAWMPKTVRSDENHRARCRVFRPRPSSVSLFFVSSFSLFSHPRPDWSTSGSCLCDFIPHRRQHRTGKNNTEPERTTQNRREQHDRTEKTRKDAIAHATVDDPPPPTRTHPPSRATTATNATRKRRRSGTNHEPDRRVDHQESRSVETRDKRRSRAFGADGEGRSRDARNEIEDTRQGRTRTHAQGRGSRQILRRRNHKDENSELAPLRRIPADRRKDARAVDPEVFHARRIGRPERARRRRGAGADRARVSDQKIFAKRQNRVAFRFAQATERSPFV